MEVVNAIPDPETCAAQIFEVSGHKFEPDVACDLWIKILEHKWFLSEKLGRDVGIRVSALDLIENTDAVQDEVEAENVRVLKQLAAKMVDCEVWSTIADSQPPKQIVNKRIILPLTEVDLATKHGVMPPKAIIFFGPPGTGKTHFVKAIAGVLRWWYVEVSPSDLMIDGAERVGANLKRLMEKTCKLDGAVVFIDEFEEIAGSRDQASRVDKSITNEFLKQVPILKRDSKRLLLVCATNYIRDLDAALLRPGRFDCIIPVGGMDHLGRKTIFEHYLSRTNFGDVDVDSIVSLMPLFTPADIEYLFQKVTQAAFEKELALGTDFRLTTDIFLETLPRVRPSLTEDLIREFQEDCAQFTRF